jgi:hypothetical protein
VNGLGVALQSVAFLILILNGCQSPKRSIGDVEPATDTKTADIQRVGTQEQIEVIDIPNRSDILFVFDTSPSIRNLWKSNNAIRQGVNNWLNMMMQSAEAYGAQARYDFFMYLTTPYVNRESEIIGANGTAVAWTHTQSPTFQRDIMEGINKIATFGYPASTAIYNSLVLAIEDQIPHIRKTAPKNIVVLTDPFGEDQSTVSKDQVLQALSSYAMYSEVTVRLLTATPNAGKRYVSATDLAPDVDRGSATDLILDLADRANVQVYVLDASGQTQDKQPFEETFLTFGKDVSTPPSKYRLKTNVTAQIFSVKIDNFEVLPSVYRWVKGSDEHHYLEFIGPPISGAPGFYPPPGSSLEIRYQ